MQSEAQILICIRPIANRIEDSRSVLIEKIIIHNIIYTYFKYVSVAVTNITR